MTVAIVKMKSETSKDFLAGPSQIKPFSAAEFTSTRIPMTISSGPKGQQFKSSCLTGWVDGISQRKRPVGPTFGRPEAAPLDLSKRAINQETQNPHRHASFLGNAA